MTENTLPPASGNSEAEFSRIVKSTALNTEAEPYAAKATPAECDALARRFDLLDLSHFSVDAEIRRWRRGIRVAGRIQATATQRCIVTLEPVAAQIDEAFDRGFLPERDLVGEVKPGAEIEIEDDPELGDLPDILMETIDLGELAAEALSLALDPYPRAEGEAFMDKVAGPPDEIPMTDDDVKPFASLAAYREKLADKKKDE